MNKLQQLLEDGKVYVDVLEVTEICQELNEQGFIFWLFPHGTTEMLIELDAE